MKRTEVQARDASQRWTVVALVLGPLVLSLLWGPDALDQRAFSTFLHAHTLAAGPGAVGPRLLAHQLFLSETVPALSPISLLLVPAAGIGLRLPPIALGLGALGWSLSAVLLHSALCRAGQPTAGTIAGALAAFNPLIVATAGTAAGWAAALACLAAAAALGGRWRLAVVAVGALLVLHAGTGTLAFALLVCAYQWRTEGRPCVAMSLALVAPTLLWGALIAGGLVRHPLPQLEAPGLWLERAVDALAANEFYGLALPVAGAGLWAVLRTKPWLGAGVAAWAVGLLFDDSASAWALSEVLGLALVGIGTIFLQQRLAAGHETRLAPAVVTAGLCVLIALPTGVVQVMALARQAPRRSAPHQALQREAATWVRAHTEPAATLMGPARMGYLAQRPTVVWDDHALEGAATPALVHALRAAPPDLCVSHKSFAWDALIRTGWFRDTYLVLETFSSPYDPRSPIVVWERRPRDFGLSDTEPLSVRLPDNRYWVGYQFEPARIGPDTPLTVTLLTHEPGPPAGPLETTVYLTAASTSDRLARQETPVSRELVAEDGRGGRVWSEQFVLTPPEDLPVGAYYVSASARKPGQTRFAHLYPGEQTYPVDRATLGYAVVPWRGELDTMTPVGAQLGDTTPAPGGAFTLLGYTIQGDAVPGATVTARLYWKAARPAAPTAETHFVFVHVLDAAGKLVAQADGPPANGRYPPQAWAPGDVVPDDHELTLDPQINAGTYHLRAGMYLWPSMDRLPARDAEGTALPDGVVELGSLIVE